MVTYTSKRIIHTPEHRPSTRMDITSQGISNYFTNPNNCNFIAIFFAMRVQDLPIIDKEYAFWIIILIMLIMLIISLKGITE